jgi:hypothetical protein
MQKAVIGAEAKGIQVGPNSRLGMMEKIATMNTQDILGDLTDETGGSSIQNTNDPASSMERIGDYVGE